MTYNEMNKFILNYLKKDITKRAIMLTGEWGAGKSHYIQNELISYLADPKKRNDADNEKYKTIVVSLYGMKSISEISKAIYIEAKWDSIINHAPSKTKRLLGKIRDSKSEVLTGVQVGARTLFKGLTSFLNVDLSGGEESLTKLFQSLKLDNTLIILEDIERTGIDIIELLGFINSMCETDGAKILLVTNEAEIITQVEKKDDNNKSYFVYSDKAAAYIRAKEKSIGDTISFTCDYNATIKSILNRFNETLSKYSDEICCSEIDIIFHKVRSSNLRAFIYACQKSSDIFNAMNNAQIKVSDKIAKKIFYGIIAFTQRQSKHGPLSFEKNSYVSGKLGVDNETPLFRFCYEYLEYQTLSIEEIQKATNYYSDYLRCSKWNSGKDEDLLVIKNYFRNSEKEVRIAISNLPRKINEGLIPYYDYGSLINFLAAIRYDADIEFNLVDILSAITNSLYTIDKDIKMETLFNSEYELASSEAKEAFIDMKNQIKKALGQEDIIEFTYDPNEIIAYCNRRSKDLGEECFACNLDIDRFIDMVSQCGANQIDTLRELFLSLYSSHKFPYVEYLQRVKKDIPMLKTIQERIDLLAESRDHDKTYKLQIRWLSKSLVNIIKMFEAHIAGMK